jgi:hypothetical protein
VKRVLFTARELGCCCCCWAALPELAVTGVNAWLLVKATVCAAHAEAAMVEKSGSATSKRNVLYTRILFTVGWIGCKFVCLLVWESSSL